uniref:Uncharacterized protein n=1 Tax=Rhizophora mucronata TaxID=61149 RepID=A0A2P2J841_RHIMU
MVSQLKVFIQFPSLGIHLFYLSIHH